MESKEFDVTDDILATKGQRFANYIIDWIVQYILILVLGFALALFAELTGNQSILDWLANISKLEDYLITFLVLIIYYSTIEILTSRSIGKFITNTIVVTENGTKPEKHTIIKRSLSRIVPFDALSFIGETSRGWHDSWTDTYVVKKGALDSKMKLFYDFEEIGKEQE